MKKKLLFSLGLMMSLFTLSSFTDGPDKSADQINGHEYVDLGLPSGAKWATCNVGATKPEELGGYYAWGETEEKDVYMWKTYKWCTGTRNSMTKYCTNSSNGTVDNKTVLDPEDDVAHVNWGGTWRMPTSDELKELLDNCIWEWTELNGVNGYKVTGLNGNSIFFPAASYCNGKKGACGGIGSYGYYWSSSLYGYGNTACFLDFSSGDHYLNSDNRSGGLSVRPVCK